MDKEYLVQQLSEIAARYNVPADREALGELVAISSFRVIAQGSLIASIGDGTGYSGLMLNGTARSYYIDSEGNDITRGFAVEGSLFMDEGLYGYDERICMWEALEDSTVMLCETSRVKDLIRSNAAFKDLWICLLEMSVRYKLYRENGFLVESAAERYMHFKKLYPEVCRRVPQKHIATYLGITPESLSRIRSAMKERKPEA
ncbi:MAG: Crp/Fnr family transcriptional regulator [Clostridiales bacterium]|jgi:CRP-like cAMP-binding protein|nr:Crp/Fnr family transcriptional regulator [Clostridiales bacterium]